MQIVVRGFIMNGVMPIDQRFRILFILFSDTIPPMRTNDADPIHLKNGSPAKGGVCLTPYLLFQRGDTSLPMLVIPGLDNKDGTELERGGGQLSHFNYEITDGTLAVLSNVALR